MAPSVLVPSVDVSDLSRGPRQDIKDLTQGWSSELVFFLNGTKIVLTNPDPEATVLEYIRAIGLTGTKLGCAEGGCGACTVIVASYDRVEKTVYHAAINACISPLVYLDGKHLITVEALGTSKNPHPAQERIAKLHGSQCGFCTPGFVMSLYAVLRNNKDPSEHDLEEAFDGNLCRCTGYRPILDAARTFATKKTEGCAMGAKCCKANGDGGEKSACGQPEAHPPTARSFPQVDFKPYDPTTELLFPPFLKKYEARSLYFGNERKTWLRPVTLKDLLKVKRLARGSAKITAGSSEIQVEIKYKHLNYDLSIFAGEVRELQQISFLPEHINVGANITLTELECQLDRPALDKYGAAAAQPFTAIVKQLKYFAGRQIRNVGTPAGAIATASPISDLNPLLMATNTTLYYKQANQEEVAMPVLQFFTGYRKTALPDDAVISRLEIPIARPLEFVRSFKQSKRKDDDIAIVTSGMRVRLDSDHKVVDSALAFGGMSYATVMALHTQDYLRGKTWTDPATLEGALQILLEKDFNLSFGVPGGMANFRRSLAIGFLFRFFEEIKSIIDGPSELESDAAQPIVRGPMVSWRDSSPPVQADTVTVGRAFPHAAAMKQVTGEAKYTDDLPALANQLYGTMVWSAKAHAKILSVDVESALALPGVVRWVSSEDIREGANRWGDVIKDEALLAEDEGGVLILHWMKKLTA